MSPDSAQSIVYAVWGIASTALALVVGYFIGSRFGPIRWIYRDPPTLQEVRQKACDAVLYRWRDLLSSRFDTMDRVLEAARVAGDAAVASAKKTKCWQCGALPVIPEETKP